MKVLMVYPEFPDTFWSFKHALPFQGKRSAFPPLGLLTISALLPKHWQKRLVDLNVQRLKDSDLDWADVVFFSGMIVQGPSMKEQIARAKQRGKRTVVGGPIASAHDPAIAEADHIVEGEAEEIIPQLAADLERGEAQAPLLQPASGRCHARSAARHAPGPLRPLQFHVRSISRAAALSPASSATSLKSTAAARAPKPPTRCARNSTSFTAWAGAARSSWWMTTLSAIRKT